MNKTFRNLILGTLLAIATAGQAAASPLSKPVLSDQNESPVRLSKFIGQVTVLEWTNPQCPFVKRVYREGIIQSLQQKYGAKGVAWLAVNSSHFTTPEDNRVWAEQQKIAFPVLADPSGGFGKELDAKTTPHMFVFNKEGEVVYRGALDDDPGGDKELGQRKNYVAQALDQLLAGEEVTEPETKPYGCSVKYK